MTTWVSKHLVPLVGNFSPLHICYVSLLHSDLAFQLLTLAVWIFVAGSGMLGISIGLNAVSSHGACTAIFVAVAAIIGFGLSSIQTLGKISFLAWIGLVCILTAIMTVTIGVGIQDRPADYIEREPFVSDYKITRAPDFLKAVTALSSLVFAYAGTPAFFAIVSEMRDPKLYTKSMLTCQTVVTITYTTIGIGMSFSKSHSYIFADFSELSITTAEATFPLRPLDLLVLLSRKLPTDSHYQALLSLPHFAFTCLRNTSSSVCSEARARSPTTPSSTGLCGSAAHLAILSSPMSLPVQYPFSELWSP